MNLWNYSSRSHGQQIGIYNLGATDWFLQGITVFLRLQDLVLGNDSLLTALSMKYLVSRAIAVHDSSVSPKH